MWLILTEGKPCGTKDCEYSSRQACHHQWQVRPPYGSWGPCLWYINHKLCLWEDISPSHDFFIWKRSINLRIIVKTSWGNICRNIQHQFRSVQPLSSVQLFATPWIAAHQASLSITNSRNSHRLMSIESVMPSSHLILCRPLLLLPPIPPSIRVFSSESLFAWGGQSTGVSASASFPPKKSQGWSPSGWTGWLSLQSKGLS